MSILDCYLDGQGFPDELIIDAHAHVAPGIDGSRDIREAADRVLRRMDAVGVDACCVMGNQYLIHGDYRRGNRDLLWLHEHYPDRFICFPTINPHDKVDHVVAELEDMYSAGMRGIKLINEYQRYPVDGAVLWAVYEFAAERGLVVLNHNWGTPDKVQEIAEMFPRMTMIMGHPNDRCDHLLRTYRNLFMCTWAFVSPYQIERAIQRIGAHKLVMGSDAVLNPFAAGIGPVVFSRVSDEEKRQVLGLNMARILKETGYFPEALAKKMRPNCDSRTGEVSPSGYSN